MKSAMELDNTNEKDSLNDQVNSMNLNNSEDNSQTLTVLIDDNPKDSSDSIYNTCEESNQENDDVEENLTDSSDKFISSSEAQLPEGPLPEVRVLVEITEAQILESRLNAKSNLNNPNESDSTINSNNSNESNCTTEFNEELIDKEERKRTSGVLNSQINFINSLSDSSKIPFPSPIIIQNEEPNINNIMNSIKGYEEDEMNELSDSITIDDTINTINTTNTINETITEFISDNSIGNYTSSHTISSVPYNPSQIAEYILNNLRQSSNKYSRSTSIHSPNVSIHSPNTPIYSPNASISGMTLSNQMLNTFNSVIVSDDDDEKSNKKQENKILNSEEGNSDDTAWLAEKEKILKLYSHKLHLLKPRMQDPNLCSHEIEFLSDFDDDSYLSD
ncbi:3581_t:CDS:2 [Diversispora eburnea]|uniref:3581_t:CDS:1 n=1 Tax=Diversispora eburnea TaxID=1213867 RepID=A0A9N9FFH3_9GLOM|nr:3581_t:CDS:2 [Diversispora eburnea]